MPEPKILFCVPEASPYAKTGGLGDVAAALPDALFKLGCDVRILMPLYRSIRDSAVPLKPVAENVAMRVGTLDYHVHVWETSGATDVPVYFLEKDEFYDRSFLYGSPARGDYEDNAERYVTFCRAVQDFCVRIDWFPDIFHLHDWQTGLVSALVALNWRFTGNFTRSGTVFTIHNLAYQGLFPADRFGLTGLPPEAFSMEGLEFWGQCNFMKAGLIYSDFLTTVSPRYSQEIQQPEFGHGLDGVLRSRRNKLAGILNGVDYSVWSPSTDPLIPVQYDRRSVASGKLRCKEALLSELGHPVDSFKKPLLGVIGRLVSQKGFDLLTEILDELMELPVSLVILGTGDPAIQEKLQRTADRCPNRLKTLFRFDERLAHWIEAGADIFLMPSHYEPCGLNQLYSLRYGTIPVVHATGGLDDSVVDAVSHPESGTGFKFSEYKSTSFLAAIQSALDLFQNREKWAQLRRRAMAQDFSWDRSARQYLQVYEKVIESKR